MSRQRAPKACQRCSNRKTKCDAAEVGLPCTRCRLDGIDNCVIIQSRRGTYDRGALRFSHSVQEAAHGMSQLPGPFVRTLASNESVTASIDAHAQSSFNIIENADLNSSSEQPASRASVRANSLRSMFEEFLKRKGRDAEELIGKYGIVLLGDSSPLTFAFNELPLGEDSSLHGGTTAVSQEPRQSVLQRQKHPSHLTEADIVYLQSRGAFELPPSVLCYGLFDAFVEHFFPFYSIFDREKIEQQHSSWTMPWILLHAICVIGASYCSINIINQAGLQTRRQFRRIFYERAKVLYDVGYETNRIVLLQAAILLTFWGPDMKSYWNPCSWIGVAVTIAESLGLHRLGGPNTGSTKEGKLLRRLWWTITVRDVHCAPLLGRPFRVNLAHCDAPILSIDDFEVESQVEGVTTVDKDQVHALYQIEALKLSLIMRKIVNLRYNAGLPATRPELYHNLEEWMTALPLSLTWSSPAKSSNIFSESLKLLFYHHLIFLYMARPGTSSIEGFGSIEADGDLAATEIAEHAAHMVSATSLYLVAKSLVHSMPQEVFAGHFVAGIVFFRLVRQGSHLTSQLARAAFENCRILLNEVRDCWDSAFWGLRVFEFLVSVTAASTVTADLDSGSAEQNEADIQEGVSRCDPSFFTATTLQNSNVSADFDGTFSSNMYDSLGSSNQNLLLPMWTFYDQELGFPQT
jgi:Fungal specific transcription factor domain/Fungal Zn(2)-Cys(6) binuclear cluster domain